MAHKRPGNNFLELFMGGAPHEQTLKAAHSYFEGDQISILSSNPEKQTNTIKTIGGGYGVENPSKVKTEEVAWKSADELWPKTVEEVWNK